MGKCWDSSITKCELFLLHVKTKNTKVCILNALSNRHSQLVGRDSSVGMPTELRGGRSWDRIPVRGRDFPHRPDRPWGPPSLLYNAYRVIPGGKAGGVWR